jgi:hypothetical protein
MMVSTKDQDWARAYAKQALSDLRAREMLANAGADKCHRLHFLQMAAEKVCKAHLTLNNGHENVRKTHAYVSRNLPIIARLFYAMVHQNNEIARWELVQIRRLAREIELLAPACDDSNLRQDNSEYPWEDGNGNIFIPCEYTFPNINDGDRTIIRLIRLIRIASEAYSR